MFLFDTDIITNILKKKPSKRLLKHLADLEIVAICIAGNFLLITGNTKHFARINTLRLENWL